MKNLILFFLLFSLLTCSSVLAGDDEELGSISGIAQDKHLAPLEGVQATIIGTDNVCITDSTGLFYFPDLEPGSYTISFSLKGYQTLQKTITVIKGQPRTFTVTMTAIGDVNITNVNNNMGVYILYVANSGLGEDNITVMPDSPYTRPGGLPDFSSMDDTINTLVSMFYDNNPVQDSYKESFQYLSTYNQEELKNVFTNYLDKKKNNLTVYNTCSRTALSIMNWNPNSMSNLSGPLWLDISDSGKLFIADTGNNVTIMDTSNNTILTTLYMGKDNMISDIAVGNSGSRVFCSLISAQPSVGIIDAVSNSYMTTVTLPRMKDKSIGYPLGIATQRYGQTAFVAMGHDYGGEVVFINTITNAVQGTVSVGNRPFGIGVTPDGRKVYVANRGSANVSVIDVSRKDEICKIAVGSSPSCIAVTPDGSRVFVTNKDENTVSVINTLTDTVFSTIPVGKEPIGISISRDGKMAFVANSMSDDVTAIDVQKNTAVNTTFPFKGGKPFDLIVK